MSSNRFGIIEDTKILCGQLNARQCLFKDFALKGTNIFCQTSRGGGWKRGQPYIKGRESQFLRRKINPKAPLSPNKPCSVYDLPMFQLDALIILRLGF